MVCRMKLRVVLHMLGMFCKGFSTFLKAKSSSAWRFYLSTFGICLNGVLGG
jgi:hypothetical protein